MPEAEPAKPEAEEQADQQMLIQETREMLRHELEESFESIATDIEPPELDDLWQDVATDIDINLAELEEMMQQDYDMDAFADQYSQISAEMFQSTANHLKDRVRQELKNATLEQVREQTIDKLARNLDKRMEERVGATEERRLTKAAQNDTRRREQEQIREARRKQEPRPAFNEAEKVAKADREAREALKFVVNEDIKDQIQEAFDETMEAQLAPESAKNILRQANRYFDDFAMEEDRQLQEELLKELAAIVQTEVPKRMKETAADLALNKTEAELQLDQVEAKERTIEIPEAEKTVAEQMLAEDTPPEQASTSPEQASAPPEQDPAPVAERAQQPPAKAESKASAPDTEIA